MHEQGGNGGKGGNPTLIFKIGYQYDLIFGGTAKIESTGRPQSALLKKRKKTREIACHAGWCRWPIVIPLDIACTNDIWCI